MTLILGILQVRDKLQRVKTIHSILNQAGFVVNIEIFGYYMKSR